MNLAFDRASVRTTDVNGRLHVELTNISMAAVNPYFGKEIPGSAALGLGPDRIYQLLRDPGELAKAAATSNLQPLLYVHEPVFPDKPEQMLVIGSTGTDAKFEHPYLKNSLVIWTAEGIKAVESKEKCELSCSYFYVPDMTPGVYEGVRYDGVMRDIQLNHIAIVAEGRAGPTVLVSDASPFQKFQPTEKTLMKNPKRVARQTAALSPLIASLMAPMMAADASIKPDELARGLALALDEAEPDGDEPPKKKPAEDEQGPDESDEDFKARMAKKKAAEDEDEDEEDDKKPGDKKAAMDAAISRASTKARADAIADMQAIRRAEKEVAPHIGEVAAMDSAAAVYRLALDSAKIDLTGVPESAYGAMVRMLRKPGEVKAVPMAQDGAAVSSFHERFPTAGKPARSY